ncbi:MAG: hypothetical protein K2X97_01840 [Mycobacteriaceae bacterium]|nr:hypothetical protein [Mycobacteriaceae bacterium]
MPKTMEAARRNGPGHLDYYARKRFGIDYDHLNPEQQQQAREDKDAFFADFVATGHIARRRGRARRMRERAAGLLAEADAIEAGLDAEVAEMKAAKAETEAAKATEGQP